MTRYTTSTSYSNEDLWCHIERNLIDTLFNFGMCDSPCLLQLTPNIANGVCQRFIMDGIVCPPKMCNEFFSTAAIDNINYNPSSATAKVSFRGTGIHLCNILYICLQDLTMVLVIKQTLTQLSQLLPYH